MHIKEPKRECAVHEAIENLQCLFLYRECGNRIEFTSAVQNSTKQTSRFCSASKERIRFGKSLFAV